MAVALFTGVAALPLPFLSFCFDERLDHSNGYGTIKHLVALRFRAF